MNDAPDRTDEELARAAKRGDAAAYDALARRYLRPAMALAWQYTRRVEDAEDIVQDAFHRAVRALADYDDRRPFSAWFYTKRGFTMGLVSGASSFGAMVLVPGTSAFLVLGDWKQGYWFLGILLFALVLPVAFLLFRNKPDGVGLAGGENIVVGHIGLEGEPHAADDIARIAPGAGGGGGRVVGRGRAWERSGAASPGRSAGRWPTASTVAAWPWPRPLPGCCSRSCWRGSRSAG